MEPNDEPHQGHSALSRLVPVPGRLRSLDVRNALDAGRTVALLAALIMTFPPAKAPFAAYNAGKLTTFDRDEYAYAALRAGASGFLLKDAQSDELSPESAPSRPVTPISPFRTVWGTLTFLVINPSSAVIYVVVVLNILSGKSFAFIMTMIGVGAAAASPWHRRVTRVSARPEDGSAR